MARKTEMAEEMELRAGKNSLTLIWSARAQMRMSWLDKGPGFEAQGVLPEAVDHEVGGVGALGQVEDDGGEVRGLRGGDRHL